MLSYFTKKHNQNVADKVIAASAALYFNQDGIDFHFGENISRESVSNSLIKKTILNSNYNAYLPDSHIICIPDRNGVPSLRWQIGQFGFEHHVKVLDEARVNILSQNTIIDPSGVFSLGFNHADVIQRHKSL